MPLSSASKTKFRSSFSSHAASFSVILICSILLASKRSFLASSFSRLALTRAVFCCLKLSSMLVYVPMLLSSPNWVSRLITSAPRCSMSCKLASGLVTKSWYASQNLLVTSGRISSRDDSFSTLPMFSGFFRMLSISGSLMPSDSWVLFNAWAVRKYWVCASAYPSSAGGHAVEVAVRFVEFVCLGIKVRFAFLFFCVSCCPSISCKTLSGNSALSPVKRVL